MQERLAPGWRTESPSASRQVVRAPVRVCRRFELARRREVSMHMLRMYVGLCMVGDSVHR